MFSIFWEILIFWDAKSIFSLKFKEIFSLWDKISIVFLSIFFDFKIFPILPTCLAKIKLFWIILFNLDDFSKKWISQYNLGVIFNSDFDDLILDINSIKLLISVHFFFKLTHHFIFRPVR